MDRVDMVVINLGHHDFALLLGQVENVITASSDRLELIPKPGTMPLWLSQMRLRYLSERLLIVELGRKLGLEQFAEVQSSEVLIVHVGDGLRCALAVDAVKQIVRAPLESIHPLPAWLNGDNTQLVWASYLDDAGNITLLLDCNSLFNYAERQWLTRAIN